MDSSGPQIWLAVQRWMSADISIAFGTTFSLLEWLRLCVCVCERELYGVEVGSFCLSEQGAENAKKTFKKKLAWLQCSLRSLHFAHILSSVIYTLVGNTILDDWAFLEVFYTVKQYYFNCPCSETQWGFMLTLEIQIPLIISIGKVDF